MVNEIQELKFQVGEAWKGVYSSSTAYGLANVVQDPTGLSIYRSLKSGNVGHPLSNASWWFRIIDLSSIKAESDRIAALNQSIAQDEALRMAAEELRQQHEAERVAAETQRDEAEQARISAEQQRVNKESQREAAEQNRITAEQNRVSAESARVQAEQARVLAETLRANAEDQRAANEQNRIAAEQQRIERADQDHQRAESDHATYVDSLGAFDISSYHATDGVLAKYADLTAALGTGGANIPDDLRKGGMSVKFVQSSDNKYMQYRLMADTFNTTTSNWQGVDDEPTDGSKNLVESDGVSKCFNVFTVGNYVNHSGIESVNSDFAVTPFIKIIPGREYDVKLYQGESAASALCLYDKDYKFISQYYADKNTVFTETLVIDDLLADYPEAAFMRMSGNISYGYFINTIRPNEVDINYLALKASKNTKLFLNSGYIRRTDGKEYEHNGYVHTDFIPILSGGKYLIKGYDSGDSSTLKISACQIYDSDKNNIGAFYQNQGNNIPEISFTAEDIIAVYPLAKYMIITGSINYGYYIIGIDAAESFKIIDEINNEINNRINIQNKNAKLFLNSGYIRRTDGKEYEQNQYVHTDFLPVLTGGKYRISAYDSGDSSTLEISAIQIYDANKNNLGAFYQHTGTNIIIDMSFTAEDIQTAYPTAKYMIITGSVNHDYYIAGIDVAEAFKHSDDAKKELENVDAQINNKIGEDTKTDTYTSDNYSNISYNSTRQEFVASGPSTNGIIIEIKSGKKYKCTMPVMVCSEIPATGKTSSIVTRSLARNIDITAANNEKYLFIPITIASFVSVTVTTYSTGIVAEIKDVQNSIDSINETIQEECIKKDDYTYNEIIKDAAEYDTINKYRERQLRQEYWDKVNNEQYVGKWYGVQWTEVDNPDNVTAINSTGDDNLHTTLPIQNKMRRCVTKDNVVQYYLDANNSELKADGTAANLDGTDGNVMVEIPEFFYKIEEEIVSNVRTIRMKISEDALPDFIFSPKRYTSAYEATINRTTGFLSSVCTTLFTRNASENVMTNSDSYIQGSSLNRGANRTARRNGHTSNAATYRGGTNDATLDQYENPSDADFARNQLGLPVANINHIDINAACDENQFGYLYDTQRILYMLIQVEFKTRNIQKSIASGGLGMGATVYPDYQSYEKFFSPQGGISCIPCGVTNSLGNASGEVYYLMENVPIRHTGSGDEMVMTFGNVWMPCMSYRGIEHYYGHIYKVADQVVCVTGPTTGYVDGHDGDVYWSKHDVSWWYEKNPYLAKINIKSDKNFLGTWNFACHIMIVSSLLMGKYGHVLHIGTKGKEGTARQENYCDCCEIDARANSNKYITFNGRIVSWYLVGNHFIVSHNTIDGGDSRPSDGTRLDHF